MKLLWLAIAILFAIGEALTPTLTLIWFSVAALVVMILSNFIESILIQVVLFTLISIILLVIATRKIVKKDEDYRYDTNLKAIINKKGIVKKNILKNEVGVVVVDGEQWSAISIDKNNILEGVEVEVIKIEGVKLIVKSISNHKKI